jgi:periplasmic divalent cation tolerance protein
MRRVMENDYCVVFNTCPDAASAEKIARALVERRLAACVNILPGLRSIYTWKGACESAEEQLLIIKTSAVIYPSLEQTMLELHPYELPEIIAVPMAAGLPDYLTWIKQATAPI